MAGQKDKRELRETDSVKEESYDGIDDIPPWYIILLGSVQLVVANISSMITAGYVVYRSICPGDNPILNAELVSTAIFSSGFCTLLQCFIGVRIPVLQGSAGTFFPVIAAMMNTPRWQCPKEDFNTGPNVTQLSLLNITSANGDGHNVEIEQWRARILEISGSLAVASCFQVIVGTSGAVGFLMNYIGPVTITPVISLIGLTLYQLAIPGMKSQVGITFLTVALVILFSLVLSKVQVPFPTYNKQRGWHITRSPLLQYFPNLLALSIAWLLCYILTITNVFTSDPSLPQFNARTDAKEGVIQDATWFFLPYPGRFGYPTFGVGTFAGMLIATIASILDSVGDYYASAKACGIPPPPKHAVNRGIAVEGLGSILSGFIGACHPTTTYGNNASIIQMTQLKNRIIWVVFSFMMIFCGVIGKIGAALSTIPIPILAGNLITSFGLVTGLGMGEMKSLTMNTRNLVIVGISILLGMMIPQALKEDPNIIKTGSSTADEILSVLLNTGLFIGGFIACVLDNITPGTKEERGLVTFMDSNEALDSTNSKDINKQLRAYDPPFINAERRNYTLCRRLPFLPGYGMKELIPDGDDYRDEINIIESDVNISSRLLSMTPQHSDDKDNGYELQERSAMLTAKKDD